MRSTAASRLARVLGLAVMLAVFAPARADADVFKLFGELHAGAMGGRGLAGAQQEHAFFANAPHGAYGALIGGRFLIAQATISHHQYALGGDGLSTWTQFGAGIAFQVDLGGPPPVPKGQPKPPKKGGYVAFAATLGFGLGTGRQVEPPLSNDEITDKGFVLEGRLELGKHLNNVFDVGVAVPVSWGYFFKNGVMDSANNEDTHYRGVQAHGLVYLRANVKLL